MCLKGILQESGCLRICLIGQIGWRRFAATHKITPVGELKNRLDKRGSMNPSFLKEHHELLDILVGLH